MKKKISLMFVSMFILVSVIDKSYGMYPILRKNKFLTRLRGSKIQTRAYSTPSYGKNPRLVSRTYRYLRNKWDKYFYPQTAVEFKSPSPLAGFEVPSTKKIVQHKENQTQMQER